MDKIIDEFEYKDIDYLLSPVGWLEAKLENRIMEGFEVRRDDERMSWRGRKITIKS